MNKRKIFLKNMIFSFLILDDWGCNELCVPMTFLGWKNKIGIHMFYKIHFRKLKVIANNHHWKLFIVKSQKTG